MVDAYADAIVLRHSAAGAARAAAKFAQGGDPERRRRRPRAPLPDARRPLHAAARGRAARGHSSSSSTATSATAARRTRSSAGSCASAPACSRSRSPGCRCPDYVVGVLEKPGRRRAARRARGPRVAVPGGAARGPPPRARRAGRNPGGPAGSRSAAARSTPSTSRGCSASGSRGALRGRYACRPSTRGSSRPRRSRARSSCTRCRGTARSIPALDSDRRAAYFRQAASGVPVRMALLAVGARPARSRRRPPGAAAVVAVPGGRGRACGARVYFRSGSRPAPAECDPQPPTARCDARTAKPAMAGVGERLGIFDPARPARSRRLLDRMIRSWHRRDCDATAGGCDLDRFRPVDARADRFAAPSAGRQGAPGRPSMRLDRWKDR